MAKSSTLPPPAWPPIFLLVDLFMHIKKYLNIVLGIQGGFFSLAITVCVFFTHCIIGDIHFGSLDHVL